MTENPDEDPAINSARDILDRGEPLIITETGDPLPATATPGGELLVDFVQSVAGPGRGQRNWRLTFEPDHQAQALQVRLHLTPNAARELRAALVKMPEIPDTAPRRSWN